MNDHYSKSALLQALQRKKPGPANIKYTDGWNDCLARVRSMISTAKPQTAHWIPKNGRAQCSHCYDECWTDSALEYKYCPNCGFYMEKEES